MPTTRNFVRVLLGVSLALHAATGVAYADSVGVGDLAPAFDAHARTAKGRKFRLAKLRGGWVFVSFCAKWCTKPCKAQLTAVDQLAAAYEGRVEFVVVMIDDATRRAKAWVKALGLEHMVIVYSPLDTTDTFSDYGLEGTMIPAMFAIDPHGIIRSVTHGFHKGDEVPLGQALDAVLTAASSP